MSDHVQTVIGVFVVIWITFSIFLSLLGMAYDAMARRFGWRRER